MRRNFVTTLRRVVLASFGALALSSSVMPLAGASEVAATVSITTPSDSVTYNPRTWNANVTGTSASGTDDVDYVDVELYDSTAALYFDGLTWGAAATTAPASGTSSWTLKVYASTLPIGHSFTMKAIATTISSGTVDSVPITFTYESSVGTFSCNSNPNLFNTGFNANTGSYLSAYSADSYWTVTGPSLTTGAGLPSPTATWTSASVNNLIPASWYATPYFNSQWISQQNADQPYQVPQNDPGDWWYRYEFNLSVADPSVFQIPFNWYSDNNIWEIYVNDVAQSGSTTGLPQNPDPLDPYNNLGYNQAGASNATLHGPFVNGLNTILVQVKSDNDYEGFNAVFRPSSICPVDLSVTKTASQSPAYLAGTSLSYTITVANDGPATAYNVGIVDTLPTSLPTTGVNAFTWTCAKVDSDSRCAVSGNTNGTGNINETIYRIVPGGSVTYTVTGTIPDGTTSALDNTATITPAADSEDSGCSPNCAATVELPPLTADLSITKTASPLQYTVGSPLTYTITVDNAGPDTATNASVVDNLPAGLPTSGPTAFTWACVSSGGASCAASGTGNISDTVTIPKDGKLVYTVTGNVPLATSGTLANTATLTPPPGAYSPNCLTSCSDTASVSDLPPSADVTIVKTVDKAEFTPGEDLTYTITVTNNSILGVEGVDVVDTLPAALPTSGASAFTWSCVASDVEVSPTIPSTCPNASGTGSLNETGIDLSAGGTVVYTVTGTVPSSVTTSLSNTATLYPHQGANDTNCNPSCHSTVTSTPKIVVDLVPSKSASPTSYVPGATLTYTIVVANNGPSDAKRATVSDSLPSGLPTSGASRFTWTCVASTGSSCTASGSGNISDTVTVVAGGTVTYTVTGIAPASLTGDRTNTVTVTPPSGTTDSGCSPNCKAEVTTPADPQTSLSITKTASPNPYVPGARLTYTIKVENAGPSDAPGTSVVDNLPSELAGHGFTWTCVASTGSTCTASGSGDISDTVKIVAGGKVTYTVTGIVPSSETATIANTATVTAGPNVTDPNCTSGCESTVSTAPKITTGLKVTKTASPTAYSAGFALVYTITVTNSGPSDAVGASVADTLPDALQAGGYTWVCTATAGSSCAASGSGNIDDLVTVLRGGHLTYSLSGTVPAGTTGDIVNTATATPPPGATDPHCSPNCKGSVTSPIAKPSIAITTVATPQGKTVKGALTLGGHIKYTFIVKNNGNTTLNNVVVTSPLSGVVCPKSTLAPGQTMVCTAVSLYTVNARDVTRGRVNNQGTAAGVDAHAVQATHNSNEVSTPVISVEQFRIDTDLGTPDGMPAGGMSSLSVFGLLGLVAVAIGLLFRRRRNL